MALSFMPLQLPSVKERKRTGRKSSIRPRKSLTQRAMTGGNAGARDEATRAADAKKALVKKRKSSLRLISSKSDMALTKGIAAKRSPRASVPSLLPRKGTRKGSVGLLLVSPRKKGMPGDGSPRGKRAKQKRVRKGSGGGSTELDGDIGLARAQTARGRSRTVGDAREAGGNRRERSLSVDLGNGQRFRTGDTILLSGSRSGKIRYMGRVKFSRGEWFGVELTDKSLGTHNGTVDGYTYFDCPEQRGIFVQRPKIRGKVKGSRRLIKMFEKNPLTSQMISGLWEIYGEAKEEDYGGAPLPKEQRFHICDVELAGDNGSLEIRGITKPKDGLIGTVSGKLPKNKKDGNFVFMVHWRRNYSDLASGPDSLTSIVERPKEESMKIMPKLDLSAGRGRKEKRRRNAADSQLSRKGRRGASPTPNARSRTQKRSTEKGGRAKSPARAASPRGRNKSPRAASPRGRNKSPRAASPRGRRAKSPPRGSPRRRGEGENEYSNLGSTNTNGRGRNGRKSTRKSERLETVDMVKYTVDQVNQNKQCFSMSGSFERLPAYRRYGVPDEGTFVATKKPEREDSETKPESMEKSDSQQDKKG